MKWLIILLIIFIVLALVAIRYRRQIQTAIYMYRMMKKMREMSRPESKKIETKKTDAVNAALVRCVGCGNWVSETEVLKMGNKISYCSARCIEKNVKTG